MSKKGIIEISEGMYCTHIDFNKVVKKVKTEFFNNINRDIELLIHRKSPFNYYVRLWHSDLNKLPEVKLKLFEALEEAFEEDLKVVLKLKDSMDKLKKENL